MLNLQIFSFKHYLLLTPTRHLKLIYLQKIFFYIYSLTLLFYANSLCLPRHKARLLAKSLAYILINSTLLYLFFYTSFPCLHKHETRLLNKRLPHIFILHLSSFIQINDRIIKCLGVKPKVNKFYSKANCYAGDNKYVTKISSKGVYWVLIILERFKHA